jgi:hypothetical protein
MSEVNFGVNAQSLASALRGVNTDMNQLFSTYYFYSHTAAELTDMDAGDFHDRMQDFGYLAVDFAANCKVTGGAPKTKFGKAIVEMSGLEDLAVFRNDGVCIESELRLFRSLGFHSPDLIEDKGYIDLPSTIILGEDDEPIGYEKSSGINSTYIWSPTAIYTQMGRVAVPGDSLNFIKFTEAIDDKLFETKAGLVAVRATPDSVERFGVGQLSTTNFPPIVRRAMAVAAAEMEPKLEVNIEAATKFKPEDVKKRVQELMATGLVEIVA